MWGIDSVLLEGGGNLNFSFLEGELVDEIYAFVAPKIVGGMNAKTSVEGRGVEKMMEALPFRLADVERLGGDVLLKYRREN